MGIIGLFFLIPVLLLFWPNKRQVVKAQAVQHGVNVTWTAGTPTAGQVAATGWKVDRSTVTGGPYTQIAAVTVTNYLDTTGTAGTKYFYVIVGTAPGAIDANSSPEASATFLAQAAAAVSPVATAQ
jgi:hypothetical protein